MILQIATALVIGAYVVLSRDAQPNRPDAAPRESFVHADHLDRDGRSELSSVAQDNDGKVFKAKFTTDKAPVLPGRQPVRVRVLAESS
jgi:hypothetical protein